MPPPVTVRATVAAQTQRVEREGELAEETPEQVNELTGEEGGVWRVVTRDSVHILDLDRGTGLRIPGPTASPTINDLVRPLQRLQVCKVGELGRWRFEPDNPFTDYYWQITSQVVRIERVTAGEEQDPQVRPVGPEEAAEW